MNSEEYEALDVTVTAMIGDRVLNLTESGACLPGELQSTGKHTSHYLPYSSVHFAFSHSCSSRIVPPEKA